MVLAKNIYYFFWDSYWVVQFRWGSEDSRLRNATLSSFSDSSQVLRVVNNLTDEEIVLAKRSIVVIFGLVAGLRILTIAKIGTPNAKFSSLLDLSCAFAFP